MKYYKDKDNQVYAYELDGSQDDLIGDKVEMTIEEVDAHIDPPKTVEQIKAQCESRIYALIQSKVDEYNRLNGLSLGDVYRCKIYGDTDGYTHQSFCKSVWLWNVQVWEYARNVLLEVESGNRTMPDIDSFMSELPEFVL